MSRSLLPWLLGLCWFSLLGQPSSVARAVAGISPTTAAVEDDEKHPQLMVGNWKGTSVTPAGTVYWDITLNSDGKFSLTADDARLGRLAATQGIWYVVAKTLVFEPEDAPVERHAIIKLDETTLEFRYSQGLLKLSRSK